MDIRHSSSCLLFVSFHVSQDRHEETPEAKAQWFQSLSLTERMEVLCMFTDLILSNHPTIADTNDAQSTSRRIRIVTKTQR